MFTYPFEAGAGLPQRDLAGKIAAEGEKSRNSASYGLTRNTLARPERFELPTLGSEDQGYMGTVGAGKHQTA